MSWSLRTFVGFFFRLKCQQSALYKKTNKARKTVVQESNSEKKTYVVLNFFMVDD